MFLVISCLTPGHLSGQIIEKQIELYHELISSIKWKKFIIEFQPPENTKAYDVLIAQGQACTLWLDNFSLVCMEESKKTGSQKNYSIFNPGFELLDKKQDPEGWKYFFTDSSDFSP